MCIRDSVRPLHRITAAIESVTEGYSDDVLHEDTFTETKQMSEAFNKMLGRLKLLDESREEFVSNVSHELKTPMTSMKVLAASLLEQENVCLLYPSGIIMVNSKIQAAAANMIHVYNRFPIALDHGAGMYRYETEGKQYLDFAAGFAVCGLGYGNRELNEALKAQIDKLYHTSNLYCLLYTY